VRIFPLFRTALFLAATIPVAGACHRDGNSIDSETDSLEDAGSDAGIDAGVDAGTDAGADSGLDTDSCGGSAWSGDLTAADDADLSVLAGITHVSGGVAISGNGVSSLESLSNLVCIDGDLDISDCPNLTGMDGLEALMAIGGNLIAGWNENLQTSEGAHALSSVGGSIWLESNPSLGSVLFPALRSIGSDFVVTNNNGVAAMELPQLGIVGRNLEIGGCGALDELSGLAALSSVGGSVYITDNAALPTCEATSLVDQLTDYDAPTCVSGNAADDCPDRTDGCYTFDFFNVCDPAERR